ncbi:sensor histidine kinase [Ferruginivarius sediminum]|uniref:histidine kinase n=1 Tax=Ferruginivarius sediminum TaxID=2661937 RepID=A0A369TCD9_9PROT|nr:HAMP domain-containing sensor histidine kinase [Ferruginivarius sediminum]RDD62948.1 sensor histidine kinase [Ferruginivarius sediminum]
MTAQQPKRGWFSAFTHSIAAKVAVVIVVFFAVPVLLYDQFRDADADRRQLLLQSLENQGKVIGEALRPQLSGYDGEALRGIGESLERLGRVDSVNIKLLLRPSDGGDPNGFYYIASAPPVSGDYLQQERAELVETGVFEKLRDTCEGNRPLAVRYVNPAGKEEVLTSVSPVQTLAGCWAVITSHGTDDALGAALGKPYWQTPEVRLAALIYVVMALLVLAMFFGVWRSLRRFAAAARTIRVHGIGPSGPTFVRTNRVPELDGVAGEFDRMVETLRNAAHAIRHAAEDNAHAFKTPIATIAQSVEPLKKIVGQEHPRARRALELIDRSLLRLDALVAAMRRMDEATAELMEAPRGRVDLSDFVSRTLDGYAETMQARGLNIERRLNQRVAVTASEDMLETVLENLLDNAIDFSPRGRSIEVSLRNDGRDAVLSVADQGPGVPEDRRQQIFERYISTRASAQQGNGEDTEPAGTQHFGIGLWLVRRNIEALGGSVHAEANSPQGLRIVVQLPR